MNENNTSLLKATKIVATIGPATESPEMLEKLILAGMNVARFNAKHVDPTWHQERILRVREVAKKLNQPVAVLLDLQGPEIRLDLPNGVDSFHVKPGDFVTFSSDRTISDSNIVYVPQEVIDAETEGNRILIDDGVGEFVIVAKNSHSLECEVHEEFDVKKRKTVNTPGVIINTPSLIPADLDYLEMSKETPVDFIALSFVRNKHDIEILKQEMANRNLNSAIVAKIENQSALDNLQEIIESCDAVMVARGDLGVEVPFEELTRWQKEIIKVSRENSKPVITATQMLKSMVENPVPTRAEVSDIANAVYDGTDAVMLSEETTIGKYPLKAVKTQARIVSYCEQYANPPEIKALDFDVRSAITHASILLLECSQDPTHSLHIDKVICLSATGATAKQLTKFRAKKQVYVFTNQENTYNQLALVYGVVPFLVDFSDTSLDNPMNILKKAKELQIVTTGEVILVVHGTDWSEPGLTNSLRVLEVK